MKETGDKIWRTSYTRQLATTITAIRDISTMQSFLTDVMTEKEIYEISARLEAARMLLQRKRYVEITAATKLSSRTVARISESCKNGSGGYVAALDLVGPHQTHTSPARTTLS